MTTAGREDLTAAIAEAVAEKGEQFLEETPAAQAEVPSDELLPEPVAQGGEHSEADDDLVPGEDDYVPPEDYWGTSLDGIPPEKVKELIDRFEQDDSLIRRQQQELAELRKQLETAPAPENESEELTDEELLQALGIDPEYVDSQVATAMLRVGRLLENTEAKLSELTSREVVRETETVWNSSLDNLEATFGKLPYDRLDVLRYAAAKGLASPADAYTQLAGPVHKEVSTAVADARRKAMKEAAGGQVRPKSTTAGSQAIKKGQTIREILAPAVEEASRETGISIRKAFGKMRDDARG